MAEIVEAPPVTPAEPEIPQGIEGAMKAFEQSVTPKPKETPPKADVKTDADPKATDPKAKVEPKVELKADPKADPKKASDPWEKADPKLKGEHFKTVRTLQDKVDSYEKRIKEIESKKVETPADTKLVEQYQKQVKELEQKIAASDYRQSAEFKKQFVDRITSSYQDSIAEMPALKITVSDADGNAIQRAATKEDFDRLLNLRGPDQDEAIAKFGSSAYRVASMVRELIGLSRQSDQALAEHAKNAEQSAKEKALSDERNKGEYQQHYDASRAELEKSWPQYFAADESDPERSEALKQGYEFVDSIAAKQDSFTPDQKAAYNAVLRARAAGFSSVVLENNRLKSEVESLKGELGKFRKSDPGAASETGAATPPADDDVPKGIEDATKAFVGLR